MSMLASVMQVNALSIEQFSVASFLLFEDIHHPHQCQCRDSPEWCVRKGPFALPLPSTEAPEGSMRGICRTRSGSILS